MLNESVISFDNLGIAINRLHDIKIEKLPIEPMKVIVKNSWHLCTYELFSHIMKMSPDDIMENLSRSAFTTYSPSMGTYIVVYNTSLPLKRIRFNLAHEIGHIYLKHITPEFTFMENLPKGEKLVRECQADKFAEFVLGKI